MREIVLNIKLKLKILIHKEEMKLMNLPLLLIS